MSQQQNKGTKRGRDDDGDADENLKIVSVAKKPRHREFRPPTPDPDPWLFITRIDAFDGRHDVTYVWMPGTARDPTLAQEHMRLAWEDAESWPAAFRWLTGPSQDKGPGHLSPWTRLQLGAFAHIPTGLRLAGQPRVCKW